VTHDSATDPPERSRPPLSTCGGVSHESVDHHVGLPFHPHPLRCGVVPRARAASAPGLGFRLRRLRHPHLKAKSEEQAALRADLEARLTAWPEEWELRCVNEATVRRHPTLTAQWCLAEDVPEIPPGDDQTKVHVYGAVAPLTGRTHHHISPKLSQEAFARFLRRLLRDDRGERRLVLHDRAAQHNGRPIDAVLQDVEGRLVLRHNPPTLLS
jgi:hypothetical protein